jgi:PAS domain S-box-containing protein
VSQPPHDFLADVYRQMPLLVFHVTTDGMVLHCNPEACRVTGYTENELLAQNIWGLLFPGRLFAQVPRFISLIEPSPLLKDVPMTIRRKDGGERIIGFSRYLHTNATVPEGGPVLRSFIVVGVDLTDRLLEADRAQIPESAQPSASSGVQAFGPHIGNAGAIDSEIVTPIAISPRPLKMSGPCPIEQVREALARVETHSHCVEGAFAEGSLQTLAVYQRTACVQPRALVLFAEDDREHLDACARTLGDIRARVDEVLAVHRLQIP